MSRILRQPKSCPYLVTGSCMESLCFEGFQFCQSLGRTFATVLTGGYRYDVHRWQ